jgi:Flp pilus assembly pilin Flp
MFEFIQVWLRLKADRRALTALEYGLFAGVVVETIAVGFSLLARDLSIQFVGIGAGF